MCKCRLKFPDPLAASTLFLHLLNMFNAVYSQAEDFLSLIQDDFFYRFSCSALFFLVSAPIPYLFWYIMEKYETNQDTNALSLEILKHKTALVTNMIRNNLYYLVLSLCDLCLFLLVRRLLAIDSVDLQQHRQVKCKLILKISIMSYCLTIVQMLNVLSLYAIHQMTLELSGLPFVETETKWDLCLLAFTFQVLFFSPAIWNH